MKYSIRGGWAESTHKTPPARLGHPQRWARMSLGYHPPLAARFCAIGNKLPASSVFLFTGKSSVDVPTAK